MQIPATFCLSGFLFCSVSPTGASTSIRYFCLSLCFPVLSKADSKPSLRKRFVPLKLKLPAALRLSGAAKGGPGAGGVPSTSAAAPQQGAGRRRANGGPPDRSKWRLSPAGARGARGRRSCLRAFGTATQRPRRGGSPVRVHSYRATRWCPAPAVQPRIVRTQRGAELPDEPCCAGAHRTCSRGALGPIKPALC